jgi:hypothetical protein
MQRILLAGFLVLGAGPALAAGRTAPPPPSGIVVHLFGPEGIWGNILPASPAPPSGTAPPSAALAPAAPASPAPAGVATAGGPPTGAAPAATQASVSTAAATPASSAAYPEPTLGAILHQMFVTGDPDRGPGFSLGRKQTN